VNDLFDMIMIMFCLGITFWVGYEMGINKDEE